jgi:outer membrane protein assembly factor BamB
MSLTQKIRINGYCEKLLLTEDKIFYADKLKNEIWSIEVKNGYALKNIGTFPNISAIAYKDNQLYLTSRTKSRIAVVDYSTLGLIAEFTTPNKPLAMVNYDDYLYVLGAQNNKIQKLNINNGKVIDTINLQEGGFSTRINKIKSTDLAVITDVKLNTYTIFDLAKGKVLKTYKTSVPLNNVIITDKVKLFD